MPLSNIRDHLVGFVGFHEGCFNGFDFYYGKDDMKYGKRIRFLEFLKLLYLKLLSHVFAR